MAPEAVRQGARWLLASLALATTNLFAASAQNAGGQDGTFAPTPAEIGATDVVEILQVPSNRYRVDVAVAIVYLRDEHSVGGYCYSEQASDIITGAYPMTRPVFEQTFAKERTRLKLPRFECTPA